MSAFAARPASRVVAGARLGSWLWGRARLEWTARLSRALREAPTRAALSRAGFWGREGPRLERYLATIQRGFPGEGCPPGWEPGTGAGAAADSRSGAGASVFLRAVHWNILKGIAFDGVLAWLRDHPRLAEADFLFLNEADAGMARSGNRHVAAELAASLNLHWAFLPAHLELTKGPGPDAGAPGENVLGLQGVAILSRRPPLALRGVRLPECFDMFAFHEKRYGGRCALIAAFAGGLVLAAVHLEVRHSPACRAIQMRALLESIEDFVKEEGRAGRPVRGVLIAGDLNTHTFARNSLPAALRGLLRTAVTPAAMLRAGLLEPWRGRREPLFAELARRGYRWEGLNDRHPTAAERLGNVEELGLVPGWLGRGLLSACGLRERRIELRLDWFAGRGIRPVATALAVTAGELTDEALPSDHLPICLAFTLEDS